MLLLINTLSDALILLIGFPVGNSIILLVTVTLLHVNLIGVPPLPECFNLLEFIKIFLLSVESPNAIHVLHFESSAVKIILEIIASCNLH